jgi:hypothetical protein
MEPKVNMIESQSLNIEINPKNLTATLTYKTKIPQNITKDVQFTVLKEAANYLLNVNINKAIKNDSKVSNFLLKYRIDLAENSGLQLTRESENSYIFEDLHIVEVDSTIIIRNWKYKHNVAKFIIPENYYQFQLIMDTVLNIYSLYGFTY